GGHDRPGGAARAGRRLLREGDGQFQRSGGAGQPPATPLTGAIRHGPSGGLRPGFRLSGDDPMSTGALTRARWVYAFGGGAAEGDASMKDLLGGKGANLAEM